MTNNNTSNESKTMATVENAVKSEQSKFNRLSTYVLGLVMSEAGKGSAVYDQALIAMSPSVDEFRMNNDDSFRLLDLLGNGKSVSATNCIDTIMKDAKRFA